MSELICRCGCEGEAKFLISGTDFGGWKFKNDPACRAAAQYCEEAAEELNLPFSKVLILSNSPQF